MLKPDELQELYDDLISTHEASISRKAAIDLLKTALFLTDEIRRARTILNNVESELR